MMTAIQSQPSGPAASLRILLVEDNMVNQRIAMGFLSRRGHQVAIANNGVEALSASANSRFDLVLMDVQMPEMDGLAATAAIRARERTTGDHLRIVALTANTLPEDRERCFAAGMDDFLPKPVIPELLFEMVEIDTPTAVPPSPMPPIDREAALSRLEGDEALHAELVALFLDECPKRMREIDVSLDAGDLESTRMRTHTLKGMAATLAAKGLCQAAERLETIAATGNVGEAKAASLALAAHSTQVTRWLRESLKV